MLNVSKIVNFLVDDAKKGEVSKKPALKLLAKSTAKKSSLAKLSLPKPINAPMLSAPRSIADWFDPSKAIEAPKETYSEFAQISKELYQKRFKGYSNVNFSEKES